MIDRRIAYFSMEIAVDPDVPTYSGGLGILAGDTLRAAADLRLPIVGVTLLSRLGYFFQRIDSSGFQTEEPIHWPVRDYLTPTDANATVKIEGVDVAITAWRYELEGNDGFIVPVLFLDTNLPANNQDHRQLTDRLYGGDDRYRLAQEAVLGIGGARILRSLGHDAIEQYHMNEGHAALLTTELLTQQLESSGRTEATRADIESVRKRCVFTTHTPVPAGHDRFDLDLVESVLGDRQDCGLADCVCHAGQLNMTYLALALSHYVNGVAKRHSEISQEMFAEYSIEAITNGVHAQTWVSPPFADLFDRAISGWQRDNFSLRYAIGINDDDLWKAHCLTKQRLIEFINRKVNSGFDTQTLTLGFARRATSYKRPELILSDLDRLCRISNEVGRLQIVYAGKAHPRDIAGKALIQQIIACAESIAPHVSVAYLPNYERHLAEMIVSGVDVWLNTPEPPLEASGTSGMKAALNGVPSLSVLDGWWIEGCIEGVTGWAIGERNNVVHQANAESLYDKLEHSVVPLFYRDRPGFIDMMRHAIALNGSFFNTQRMLHEYMVRAYKIGPARRHATLTI